MGILKEGYKKKWQSCICV